MAERYLSLNEKYSRDGDRLLAEGDYVQAGEKYWGAVATMIKAIAEQRAWRHASHRHLGDAARRISDEVDEPEILELFKFSEALHANFYENFMLAPLVRERASQAKRFITRLQALTVEGRSA